MFLTQIFSEDEQKDWKYLGTVLLGAVLILVLALWFNKEQMFYGPAYADDFLLWQTCMERTFFEMVFTDRPITNGICWLLFHLCGTDYSAFDVFLRFLLIAIAMQAYFVSVKISKNMLLGVGVGICTVVTQFSDYIRTQAFGVMEGFSHLFAVFVLYELFCVLNESAFLWKRWIRAGLFFLLASLTHERYMVLATLFVVVALLRLWKNGIEGANLFKSLLVPGVALGFGIIWRFLQLGSSFLMAQGTDVRATFDISGFFHRVLTAILYLFGINTGEHWFCWTNWEQMPLAARGLSVVTSSAVVLLVILGVILAFARKKDCTQQFICNILFLMLYIGSLIAIASSTTRVELRWLYVPYVAALLLLIYILQTGLSDILRKCGTWIVSFIAGVLFLFYLIPYLVLQTYYMQYYWQVYYYVEWNDASYVYTELVSNQDSNDLWNQKEVWLIHQNLNEVLPEDYLIVYDPDLSDGTPLLHLVKSPEEVPQMTDVEDILIVGQ